MVAIATPPESRHFPGVISPAQTRGARNMLGWTQAELAVKADVGLSTVKKLESGQNVRPAFIECVQRAIEAAGVRPINADEWGGEGVRFVK